MICLIVTLSSIGTAQEAITDKRKIQGQKEITRFVRQLPLKLNFIYFVVHCKVMNHGSSGKASRPNRLEEKESHVNESTASKISCKTAEDTNTSTLLDVCLMPKPQISSKKPHKLHWG